MCNRHLSRKYADLAAGTGTIDARHSPITVDAMAQAAKAARLLRSAENRAERRGYALRAARHAAKACGAYNDLRGSDVYKRFDEARWLLVNLNRQIERAVLLRDVEAAFADNYDTAEAIGDRSDAGSAYDYQPQVDRLQAQADTLLEVLNTTAPF